MGKRRKRRTPEGLPQQDGLRCSRKVLFGSDDVRALDQLPAAQLELVSALGASWGGTRDELLNSAALLEL